MKEKLDKILPSLLEYMGPDSFCLDDNEDRICSIYYNTDNHDIIRQNFSKPVYGDVVINALVFMYDVNEDGFVNAKDYSVMSKNSKYDSAKPFFENFIDYKISEFSYK